MTEQEAYQEHIRYTHDTYCRIVIRHASFDAARTLAARWKREISLEYLTEEKFVPLSTTDEYFQVQDYGETYPFSVRGQTIFLDSCSLAAALARLPEQTQEEMFLYYFQLPTMKSLDSSASKKADGKAEGAQTAGDNNGFFTPNSKSDFRAVKVKECVAVPKSKKLLQFTLDDGTGTDRTILSGIHAYYEPEELVGKTRIAITNLPPRAMMGIESCGMLLSAVCEENGEEKLNLLMVDNHIPAGAKLY